MNFTITWRVKNFSMCPTKFGSFIESPVVLVRQFGDSEWNLKLYPKGHRKEGFVACFLYCKSVGVYNNTVKVGNKLSVFNGPSNKILTLTENDFTLNNGWGQDDLISIAEISKKYNGYLPKDTLTITCSMQCKDPSDSKNVDMEIIKALSRNFNPKKPSLHTNKFCCETTIRVQTKRFLWPIPRFLSLSENERITMPVFLSMKGTSSFNVTLFKNAESLINIEIRRKNEKSKKLFVRCMVSAVNAPKDVNYCLEDEFLFEKEDDVFTFSRSHSNLEKDLSVLWDNGYFQMNDYVLFLQFDLAFSIEDELHHIERQDWEPPFPPTKRFVPLDLFIAPATYDEQKVVTLRSEGETFTVHRALLKAKSEVFHAMFETDMKEKETGIVDIPDVNPKTLRRMLSFLYSFTVADDLRTADVIKLNAAAHKYQILPLMGYCSSLLMSSLNEFNVCDILQFADLYGEDRLLKTAEDFLIGHADFDRVLVSQNWNNLMEKNASLVANIMYKILLK